MKRIGEENTQSTVNQIEMLNFSTRRALGNNNNNIRIKYERQKAIEEIR
jgi:hypothetical protein